MPRSNRRRSRPSYRTIDTIDMKKRDFIKSLIASGLLDISAGGDHRDGGYNKNKMGVNGTNWNSPMLPYEDQAIDKKDLAIGLGAGFAGLFIMLIIFVIYLRRPRTSVSSKPDANNIYVVLPNGQTVQGQKAGVNVTVDNPNDIYALGGALGGAPLLPPRAVSDDDTYARIVESIYSSTPSDKVLNLPMDDRKTSGGSHYVSSFMGPAMVNPAYGGYGSPISSLYGDHRIVMDARSNDALSFDSAGGEENTNSQASGSTSPAAKSSVLRSVSQNEAGAQGQNADDADKKSNAEALPQLPAQEDPYNREALGRGAYGPLPGPLVLRPVVDRGQVSYVLDAETGYRSRMYPPAPPAADQFIYVRDPESGYRSRAMPPGAPFHPSQNVYVFDPESGIRMRAPPSAPSQNVPCGAEGGAEGPQPSPDPQPSSSAGANPSAAEHANEQFHSGESHDSQSSTASGASSSTPLASASAPLDMRPPVPRQGYAGGDADVPTVIRRFNADTGEEYIYTLAVSRLPRNNVYR